ncbi:regulatory protein RecX [Paenibacillus mendelii]|uniref:Regulatory protein RecX n=1 Tax=Paenibacillus mendelii TaxID=206163 RepID=A0ABV6JGD7_9BACL|nr:RecX family transcriptional regulator [Paenibacillus mendelii]MCQ6557843.1 RecX family transcriptional regulator [Paenibacillus mendelii]
MNEENTEGMLTITAVEQDRKERYRYQLFVNNGQEEPFLSVHEDIMIRFRLLKGREIHVDELKQITEEDTQHRAYALGLIYLGARQRTHKEIARYLARKGIDEMSAEQAIQRLIREGFVDDAAFAKQFASGRLRSQMKGRRLLQQELRQRGIAKETVNEAIDRIDTSEEAEVAIRAACKKWPYLKGEPTDRKRKLATFLLRRGFPGSIVKQAIQAAIAQEELDEEGHMLDN